LSSKWWIVLFEFLKILAFLSFHKTQAKENQTKWIMSFFRLEKPPKEPNWAKWYEILSGVTKTKPNQSYTANQIWRKKLQWRNRWVASSRLPHPPTHRWEVTGSTPLFTKLSFVGKQLRRRRHTKILTFRGTSLCQEKNGCHWHWYVE